MKLIALILLVSSHAFAQSTDLGPTFSTGGGGGGVSSLNSLAGALNIVAGTGITVTPAGSNITIAATGAGSGTVTSVSVVSANGLAGTVATATTTPAITLSTSITGILKGNGTSLSAAVAGDFPTLNQNTTGTASNITASSNATLTTLSALSLPGAQVTGNISGNAANVTGVVAIANGGTGATSFTTGSIPFMGATTFIEDNPDFNWDNSAKVLNIVGTINGSVSAADAGADGGVLSASTNTTVDGSNTTLGINGVANGTVQSGATNDKEVGGINFSVTRGDGSDDGNLSALIGSNVLMFHNSGAAGITDKAYGYATLLFSIQGTVTNLYDFFSQRVPAGTGVVSNHYGVYIANDNDTPVKNWLSGQTQLEGSSFSANIDAALDIQGNKALLYPRLSTTEKNALTPVAGMTVYDTDLGEFDCYTTAWGNCGSGGSGANTALSNLTATAVNDNILPANTDSVSLGASGNEFLQGFFGNVVAATVISPAIDSPFQGTGSGVDTVTVAAATITMQGHILSSSNPPTATVQANAGTGATCSVQGTDTLGQITLATGTIGISTGAYCNINFDVAYGAAPFCVLTPASSAISTSVYVTSTTSVMAINFAIAGGVSTTYVMNYHCGGT